MGALSRLIVERLYTAVDRCMEGVRDHPTNHIIHGSFPFWSGLDPGSMGSKCANSFSLSHRKSTHYLNAGLPLNSQHHNYTVAIQIQTQL